MVTTVDHSTRWILSSFWTDAAARPIFENIPVTVERQCSIYCTLNKFLSATCSFEEFREWFVVIGLRWTGDAVASFLKRPSRRWNRMFATVAADRFARMTWLCWTHQVNFERCMRQNWKNKERRRTVKSNTVSPLHVVVSFDIGFAL